MVIIALSLFVPVLEASDEAQGDSASKGTLARYSQYALVAVIAMAPFGALLTAYLINLFIGVFVTGDYFYGS